MIAQLYKSKNHWNLSLVKFVECKLDLIRSFKNYARVLIPKGGINVGYQSTTKAQAPCSSNCHWHVLSLERGVYSQTGPLRAAVLVILFAHQCNFRSSALWAPGGMALSGPLLLVAPCDSFWPIRTGSYVDHVWSECLPVEGAPEDIPLLSPGEQQLQCSIGLKLWQPPANLWWQVIWIQINLYCVMSLRLRACLLPQHKLADPDWYMAAKFEPS